MKKTKIEETSRNRPPLISPYKRNTPILAVPFTGKNVFDSQYRRRRRALGPLPLCHKPVSRSEHAHRLERDSGGSRFNRRSAGSQQGPGQGGARGPLWRTRAPGSLLQTQNFNLIDYDIFCGLPILYLA